MNGTSLRALSCLVIASMAAAMGMPASDQAAKAVAILDSWEKSVAREDRPKILRVVLWTPSDREPLEGYKARIDGVMHEARDFFAREMSSLGFGIRAPRFEYQPDGMIRIHIAKGRSPLASYGSRIASEIREDCYRTLRQDGLKPAEETILVLCHVATWNENQTSITRPRPFFSEGNHRKGIAWAVDSPLLDTKRLAAKDAVLTDSELGVISAADHVKHALFQLCQDIGHSVGLPNHQESLDERRSGLVSFMNEKGIPLAGRAGDHGITPVILMADGLRLAAHPLFAPVRQAGDVKFEARVEDWKIQPTMDGLRIGGRIQSKIPVHGVIAYLDPDGDSDHDAFAFPGIPESDGSFEIICGKLDCNRPGEIRIVILQADGNASGFMSGTPHRVPYQIGPDGELDLGLARSILTMTPLAEAFWCEDEAQAARLMESDAIRLNPSLSEIARRWMRRAERDGNMPPMEGGAVALGDLPGTSANTGYGPAVWDRLPGPQPLLLSGNRLFSHGLYAHAPSTYTWELKGAWKKLVGTVGLADGHKGSAVFSIELDGKTCWKSSVIREGMTEQYELDLSGARRLVLKTSDAGDGRANDWAMWLEPTISK